MIAIPETAKFYKVFLPRFILFFLYAFTSGLILLLFINHPEFNEGKNSPFPEMVYGRAKRPYVYRTLLPTTVRVIAQITPTGIKEGIVSFFHHRTFLVRLLDDGIDWKREYRYEYLIALVFFFLSFFGFALLLRRLIRRFYNFPHFVSDFAPIFGLLLLPLFSHRYCHLYDPITIFLFTLAFLFIAQKRFFLFYLTFFLTALNKETATLLSGIFFLSEEKARKKLNLLVHLGGQILIWIGIRVVIAALFRNNPGSFLEFHLLDYNWPLLFRPFRLIYFILILVLFWLLIRYGWDKKPFLLRRGFLFTFLSGDSFFTLRIY